MDPRFGCHMEIRLRHFPDGFDVIASTSSVKVAAFKIKGEETYGIQFHPEVTHSTEGKNLLRNFVVKSVAVPRIGLLMCL
jgi:GMP synthase-like glutamine amidotransferase